jgi:hypothetical protein
MRCQQTGTPVGNCTACFVLHCQGQHLLADRLFLRYHVGMRAKTGLARAWLIMVMLKVTLRLVAILSVLALMPATTRSRRAPSMSRTSTAFSNAGELWFTWKVA